MDDIIPELCLRCYTESMVDERCYRCYPLKIKNVDARCKYRRERFKHYLFDLNGYVSPSEGNENMYKLRVLKYKGKDGVLPIEFSIRNLLKITDAFVDFSKHEKTINYLYIIKEILMYIGIENNIKCSNIKSNVKLWNEFVISGLPEYNSKVN